jgi:hypothetical protein
MTQKNLGGSGSRTDYPVAWRKCESEWHFKGYAKSICLPAKSIRTEALKTLAIQRKTKAVSRVFAEKANTEHTVFLQEMRRRSAYSGLLREVAYACDPVSHWAQGAVLTVVALANTYRCTDVTENICRANKCFVFLWTWHHISYGVKKGVSTIKIHRNVVNYITQTNFLIYQEVSWVRFTAKKWQFVDKCRNLFSFTHFLFDNFMLYRADNISVFVEACKCKI